MTNFSVDCKVIYNPTPHLHNWPYAQCFVERNSQEGATILSIVSSTYHSKNDYYTQRNVLFLSPLQSWASPYHQYFLSNAGCLVFRKTFLHLLTQNYSKIVDMIMAPGPLENPWSLTITFGLCCVTAGYFFKHPFLLKKDFSIPWVCRYCALQEEQILYKPVPCLFDVILHNGNSCCFNLWITKSVY